MYDSHVAVIIFDHGSAKILQIDRSRKTYMHASGASSISEVFRGYVIRSELEAISGSGNRSALQIQLLASLMMKQLVA